jgi:hypothetical protein
MINAAFCLSLLLFAAGCSSENSCPEIEKSETVTTGVTDLESLTYVSAPWDGPLTDFPGRSSIAFVHGLGVVPDFWATYVSFEQEGTGNSDVTENVGDQGEVTCVDENAIVVRNGTCSNFFVRVVAKRLGDTGVQSRESCKLP